MEELLTVSGLSKTFHLSKKQQKLEKTTEDHIEYYNKQRITAK